MNTKHLIILIFLFTGQLFAQKSQSQIDELKGTRTGFIKAETVKEIESNLIKAYRAERNSKAVTNMMNKFWKEAKKLNKKQAQLLAKRFANASKTSLKQFTEMSSKQFGNYVDEVTNASKNINIKTLKRIIHGAGDKAGNASLKMVSEIDNAIARTGKVPVKLLKKLSKEAKKLSPKRAKAMYRLFKSKLKSDWSAIKDINNTKKGLGNYVGTIVDGVFVFNDAVNIYYSDDEPEVKGIKATSKIIDYGISTGAGAASAAVGGGLGPGLVIAFTANRVSTLYTEIMMLEKEKREAANAEEEVKINNALLVRREFIYIGNMIKSGRINNAKFLIIKVQKFILKHDLKNGSKLLEITNNLEEKAKQAKRNEEINSIINQARRSFIKAQNLYKRGVELQLAKIYINETLDMLLSNLKYYPEIGKLQAIDIAKKLKLIINTKISEAAPFGILEINAPKQVLVNEYIKIYVTPKGGIPFYYTSGILGNISQGQVTVYWQAPSKSGKKKLTITIKDCMGKIASKAVSIDVVSEKEPEPEEELEFEETNNIEGTWEGYFQITENKYREKMVEYTAIILDAIDAGDDAQKNLEDAQSIIEEPVGLKRKRQMQLIFKATNDKYKFIVNAIIEGDDKIRNYKGTAKYKKGTLTYELKDLEGSIHFTGKTTRDNQLLGTFIIGSKYVEAVKGEWKLIKK